MAVRKVYVDPGHGGSDPGAVGNGVREADVALAVAVKVADHLRRHGLEVRLSRTVDTAKSLQARTDEANAWGADAYVSIHCNAAGTPEASGWEVWHTIHEERSMGDELAEAIADQLKRLPMVARGTKSKPSTSNPQTDYYHVIRETRMPAVIVECGFVTSPKDAGYLKSAEGQAAIAEAIARGVIAWAGLAWRPAEQPKSAPVPSPAPKAPVKPGPFRDVPGDHWAAVSIERLKRAGIIEGFADGTFRPDEPVTRAQLAAILDRLQSALRK
ncbi:cell wall hydrolase/autolysin [Thermaerobacter marianensis DSM 12885]|uniref:Cell wall hydrolase/autolysin n=1 Tax=Thermaerobacter marianensis (strain ATCC 700841 / DSM 12885 / JCM 10246 / 7p75a) TaxID=644966 RepID=E6SKJ6_THEM7|nr:N-acetylmuramoyl-L-alanine amidase [Thermaerobacter marianensis]ADU50183.1 cell wall hydrolase/autolysin [Thermaerobacter marianensis DSM 12885]